MAVTRAFQTVVQALGALIFVALSAACSDSNDRALAVLEPTAPVAPWDRDVG